MKLFQLFSSRSIYLVLFFLVSIESGSTQSFLTVDEAVETGLANSLQIQILRNNQEITVNSNNLANADLLPVVAVNGSYGLTSNNTQQQFFNGESQSARSAGSQNARAAAEANWTVFDGFRRDALQETLDLDERRSSEATREGILQTIEEIQLAYYQIAQVKQQIELGKRGIKLDKDIETLAIQKQRIGTASRSEVLQASSQLNADSILLIGLEGQIARMKIAFNRLLNRSPDVAFEVDTILEVEPLPRKEIIIESAAARNPTLLLAGLERLSIAAEIKEIKSVLYPKIDFNASYDFNYSKAEVGFLLSNRSYGPSAGVTLSYDIYSGRNLKNEVRNVEIYQGTLEMDQLRIERNIESRISDLYAYYENLMVQLIAEERNVDISEENSRLANELYRQGRNTSFEVREAIHREILDKNRFLQVKYNLKFVEIEIRSIAGLLM